MSPCRSSRPPPALLATRDALSAGASATRSLSWRAFDRAASNYLPTNRTEARGATRRAVGGWARRVRFDRREESEPREIPRRDTSRRRTRSARSREGLPDAADLSDADQRRRNRVESDGLHERFRERPRRNRNREFSAQPRNPANEMRFPASREDSGNASAVPAVRGGRGRHSLAGTRGARTPARCIATRYLSRLALRSPVKSHSAGPSAHRPPGRPSGLRSICR